MHPTIHTFLLATVLSTGATLAFAQQLPVKWEELTAPDFVRAIEKSHGVCLLPIGVLEKHGPHLPLGTDLINVRYVTVHAAQSEYAPVFPEYYFGQIFEAMHQPGTIAYSGELQLRLLQETANEMARNGCTKIIIVNGHGGNPRLLQYFSELQLASPRNYQVYIHPVGPYEPPAGRPPRTLPEALDGHAGESETARTLISRPDLVHLDRASDESGEDLNRFNPPPELQLYSWLRWYSRFPNHYSGVGSVARRELGEFDMSHRIATLAKAIRWVKGDDVSLPLLEEFYKMQTRPLETPQGPNWWER